MQPNTPFVVLRVQGIGHVPSFKNNKLLTRGKLITNPKRQKWMEQCVASFMRQLLYSFPMSASETVTAQKVRSWIASSTPENDSCKCLIQCSWRFCKYPKGLEGAEITLVPLDGSAVAQ